MTDRISPPSWTEWTRNPSERSHQRKEFDDISGELRKEGLIEVKSSLFVHLARYSFLQVKNAVVDVRNYIRSVPDGVIGQISPSYRQGEVDAMLRILEAAGLCTVLETDGAGIAQVQLTERRSAGEVAKGQVTQTLSSHLREFYGHFDPAALVLKSSSFPTPDSVSKATKVDRAHLAPGEGTLAVQDRPEGNEANPSPFLQETIDARSAALLLLQFWPLPDPKGGGAPADPEFSLLVPADIPLSSLVREYAIPLLAEYFRSSEHHDLSSEIQAKYSTYMHKYRERFASGSGIAPTDRIDKVLVTADPEGEAFANAVYVVAQVLKGSLKDSASNLRASSNPIVYQAARIGYAHVMALRVKKRKAEKDAAARAQDSALLVARLRDAPRPLALDELKRIQDAAKQQDLGSKYKSVLELLPLVPAREGERPAIFEVRGQFFHRENLVRYFLELREREALAQRERLSQLWARQGIPAPEDIFLGEDEVSVDFLKTFELIHQERVLALNTVDFLKEYVPEEAPLEILARFLWPEGHRGALTPLEIVSRGLDPLLYEDKDRLRRRGLVGVLELVPAYPLMVKAAWNIVFMEDGLFRFLIRRLLSFFGGKLPRVKKAAPEAPAPRKSASSSASASGEAGRSAVSARKAELKKLERLVPAAADRAQLETDREKLAAQWCLKLDKVANEKTRAAVDAEVRRWALKMKPEELTEENSAKVAIFLMGKSSTLGAVTSSRAYHRYLYLTAVEAIAEFLGR